MTAEIKLGLCSPPEPIYLYVKNAELGGETYLWYKYDIEKDKTIPVYERGLTGYLSELRLTTKEFKGKSSLKLDIMVSADEVYVVRSGVETNFSKSFLLALSQVQDLSKPLIIAVTASEENIVFCSLYDATTKSRIRREWDANADVVGIVNSIQSRLSATEQQILSVEQRPTQVQPAVESQDVRVKKIRTLVNYPLDLIKEWLHFQSVNTPSQLHVSKVDELVKTMCLAWADDKFDHPNHAANSYQKYVVDAIADGVDELVSVNAWMQHIQSSSKL